MNEKVGKSSAAAHPQDLFNEYDPDLRGHVETTLTATYPDRVRVRVGESKSLSSRSASRACKSRVLDAQSRRLSLIGLWGCTRTGPRTPLLELPTSQFRRKRICFPAWRVCTYVCMYVTVMDSFVRRHSAVSVASSWAPH